MVRRPRGFQRGAVRSHAHPIKVTHAAKRKFSSSSQKSRALALFRLVLFSFRCALSSLVLLSHESLVGKKYFCIKNHFLALSLSRSLARVVNIAWPVQKRNFELESLTLSRLVRCAALGERIFLSFLGLIDFCLLIRIEKRIRKCNLFTWMLFVFAHY